MKTATSFETNGTSMQKKPCFHGREAPFENVLQVVPLGANFQIGAKGYLPTKVGENAVATPALGQKGLFNFINSAAF